MDFHLDVADAAPLNLISEWGGNPWPFLVSCRNILSDNDAAAIENRE
mgnify:CR=1 FL=1